MGGLISSEGIEMQEKAYQATLNAYPDGDAAEYAFKEEKVSYIVAISKDVLRNYTVLPFGLLHEATEDIHLKWGVIIPKGIRLYMNSEGGNHGM
jgi:phenylacetate 2-hydroxylase